MPQEILINSFVQTGVTTEGLVDHSLLHSRLKEYLAGQQVEQQQEEEHSGLTDDEDDSEDETMELPEI
jgi:hypothetical protein